MSRVNLHQYKCVLPEYQPFHDMQSKYIFCRIHKLTNERLFRGELLEDESLRQLIADTTDISLFDFMILTRDFLAQNKKGKDLPLQFKNELKEVVYRNGSF